MNFSKKNHESRQVNIKEMSKKYIIIAILFSVSLISAQTTAGKYTIKNINVNTKSADFGTAYFGTDSVVFSSPRSKRSLIRNIWKPNEQPYLDLYVGKIGEGGEIEGKRKVKGAVNTRFHEAIVAFTNDMKTVYYTGNNNYQNVVRNDTTGTLRLQLYKAAVTADGTWTNIEKLPFNNDEFSTGHPALNGDGTKLYFVSDRPGTLGQTDIYRVDINADGSYSDPENLGTNINSPGKEMFPYLVDDIIYYSSDGHHGAGGLDVFANRMFDTTISRPLNLGEPINSAQDDFALILKDGKGYFSSNRENGVGDDDIYSVLADENLKIIIECDQKVAGIVKDKDTGEPVAGAVVNLFDNEGQVIETITTDATGTFNFGVKCANSYKLTGEKKYYASDEKKFTTVNDIVEKPIVLNLAITAKIVNNKVKINPIYFDLNKAEIRPDAAIELDKVVSVMKEYPELNIEAGSHTDSRGSKRYNERLSTRRAKATVEYIVSKGIDANRITAKGYGESQLTNKCANKVECTDAEHQANRRTEFVIVTQEEDKFSGDVKKN